MKFTRKDFMASAAAFAVSPMLAADGRQIKTPLMLDTKRMAIHDGPGIRTTFFVKGCPLRYIWCHNPESLSSKPQWARFQHLCRECAKCTMDEAKAKIEVRCLSVPNCTDGADLAARHRYLNSIGISESAIVDLKYYDYARSKYLALGMKDTMP